MLISSATNDVRTATWTPATTSRLVEGGIDHFTVEFHTDTRPAAAHKARRLRKVVTAVCMTGASYANLRVNKGVETGALPWGEWMDGAEPFVIQHKGQDYARLYVIEHGVTARLHRGRRGRGPRHLQRLPHALAASTRPGPTVAPSPSR